MEHDIQNLAGVIYTSGITLSSSINDISEDKWSNSININLRGYKLTFKYLYDLIINIGNCSIVQINSKTGKKGIYKNSSYIASKFGGFGLTQSMALELI